MAYRGITHCKNCGKSLKMEEYYLCNNCEAKKKKLNKETEKMNKVYKGYELIKAIADGEIKERNKI